MKLRSVLLAGFVSFVIFGTTSCTQDYICQCEIAYSGQPGLPDTLINEYPLTDTKKNAQQICEEGSGEYEKEGIKTVETCALY
ncbi:MAG: hypothetical protein KDC07_08305 [Chitinophagaceae bacterium]|nr:hypothetical protein [Chitinophagaceae bacterium]MCB9046315.1 hypothetical protein [Chitinophagales bacterium]